LRVDHIAAQVIGLAVDVELVIDHQEPGQILAK
jgi:hypothetical protein